MSDEQREEPKALVDNAADEEQIERGKRAEKLRRRRELEDMRAVLEMPQGRRVLNRIIAESGLHLISVPGSGEALWFNEGRRNMGAFVQLEAKEASRTLFITLLQEAIATELANA